MSESVQAGWRRLMWRRLGGPDPNVAPAAATFIVQTANASLPNAQALGALATGILKSTTATGVVSIAVAGTDYVAPNGVAGGQTIKGDTAASGNLTLQSTANATLGSVIVTGPIFSVNNTANTATDHTYVEAKVGGAAAGDPHVRFTIPTGTSWYAGADNSDSDKFEIGTGTSVGTSALFSITSTGLVGVNTVTQAARFEVVTDSDTTAGAPGVWDGKFLTVGAGGANGTNVSLSVNQSTNTGYLECITPGTQYRTLSINNGALSIDGNTKNVGVSVAPSGAAVILNVGGTRTVASAAGAVFDAITLSAGLTLSGSTNITTATGVNLVNIPAPAYNAASALTITHAASVYIAGAPVGGGAGPATITNRYSLWIDSGQLRYDGQVANGGGSAPTFGTIGGSGPTTAAQSGWLPINIDGNARFIPVWA